MRMMIGTKVIYPSQGPCLIGSIVQKEIAGSPVSCYQLALLDESGGELFVPVARARTSGLRQMLRRSEIPALLSRLQQPTVATKDWKQRAGENSKRLASGSAFDLVEIIKSLTALSAKKELSFTESRTLEKARRLMIGEIAEVLSATRSAAEELIDHAIKAPKAV